MAGCTCARPVEHASPPSHHVQKKRISGRSFIWTWISEVATRELTAAVQSVRIGQAAKVVKSRSCYCGVAIEVVK